MQVQCVSMSKPTNFLNAPDLKSLSIQFSPVGVLNEYVFYIVKSPYSISGLCNRFFHQSVSLRNFVALDRNRPQQIEERYPVDIPTCCCTCNWRKKRYSEADEQMEGNILIWKIYTFSDRIHIRRVELHIAINLSHGNLTILTYMLNGYRKRG